MRRMACSCELEDPDPELDREWDDGCCTCSPRSLAPVTSSLGSQWFTYRRRVHP